MAERDVRDGGSVEISDNELLNEVIKRNLGYIGCTGLVIQQRHGLSSDEQANLNEDDRNLCNRLDFFLSDLYRQGAEDHLSIMSDFWQRLGYDMPQLDVEQVAILDSNIGQPGAQNHTRRIIPTPLLDLGERRDLVERARDFGGAQFSKGNSALSTPFEKSLYARLLSDPEVTVEGDGEFYGEKDKLYALGYRASDGDVVTRSAYIDSLKAVGQAVEADDGTIWIYPIIETSNIIHKYGEPRDWVVGSPRFSGGPTECVEAVEAPETLIAIQLIHQAVGTPSFAIAPDNANEAVYEIEAHGSGSDQEIIFSDEAVPGTVATVNWDARSSQIRLYDSVDRFGARLAENGLSSPVPETTRF